MLVWGNTFGSRSGTHSPCIDKSKRRKGTKRGLATSRRQLATDNNSGGSKHVHSPQRPPTRLSSHHLGNRRDPHLSAQAGLRQTRRPRLTHLCPPRCPFWLRSLSRGGPHEWFSRHRHGRPTRVVGPRFYLASATLFAVSWRKRRDVMNDDPGVFARARSERSTHLEETIPLLNKLRYVSAVLPVYIPRSSRWLDGETWECHKYTGQRLGGIWAGAC